MITDKIEQYLKSNEKITDEALRFEVEKMAGAVFKRQFMDSGENDSKGKLWISSVGKCVRALGYSYHGFEKEGKEIDSRAKMVFWTGDLIELTVVALAKLAGVRLTATGLNQMPLKLPINGAVITGYPDGLIFHEKEIILLNVKSMSSYAFERFETGDVDESYRVQMNIEMEALGLTKTLMVAICKESGVMHEILFVKDDATVQRARDNVMAVVHSTPETLPEAPAEYGPDAKGFYQWNCLYCAYWKKCRPNAETVPVNGKYKLKEKTDGLSSKDVGSGSDDRKSGDRVRRSKSAKLAPTGTAESSVS